MKIHQALRRARENAKLTQEAVGKLFGISRSSVAQWEAANGTAPELERLPTLARAYGCSIDQLLGIAELAATSKKATAAPPTPDLSPEALHMARAWMQLSPARRASYHEEIVWTSVFERKFPYYRIGRPTGESYDKLESSIEANWEKMMRQAMLPLE